MTVNNARNRYRRSVAVVLGYKSPFVFKEPVFKVAALPFGYKEILIILRAEIIGRKIIAKRYIRMTVLFGDEQIIVPCKFIGNFYVLLLKIHRYDVGCCRSRCRFIINIRRT